MYQSKTNLIEVLFRKQDEVIVIKRNGDCFTGALYQYDSVG